MHLQLLSMLQEGPGDKHVEASKSQDSLRAGAKECEAEYRALCG